MTDHDGGIKSRIGHVWNEGKAIHVTVDHKDGRRLVDLPLSAIVIGGVLAPWALGIGAAAAAIAGCSMGTERTDAGEDKGPADAPKAPEAPVAPMPPAPHQPLGADVAPASTGEPPAPGDDLRGAP